MRQAPDATDANLPRRGRFSDKRHLFLASAGRGRQVGLEDPASWLQGAIACRGVVLAEGSFYARSWTALI